MGWRQSRPQFLQPLLSPVPPHTPLPIHWDKCQVRGHWLTKGLLPHIFPSSNRGAQKLTLIFPPANVFFFASGSYLGFSQFFAEPLASYFPWEQDSFKAIKGMKCITWYVSIQLLKPVPQMEALCAALSHCGQQHLHPALWRRHMWKWTQSFGRSFLSSFPPVLLLVASHCLQRMTAETHSSSTS